MKLFVGDPKAEHISTSYVERQNLNMRMNMRRNPGSCLPLASRFCRMCPEAGQQKAGEFPLGADQKNVARLLNCL